MKLTIYADGGARGNPGPAAAGVVIKNQEGKILASYGEYLDVQTNNYAEYSALISGLKKAHSLGADEVECFLDSQLVAEQLNGRWKVRNPHLQRLFLQAWKELQGFRRYRLVHTRRRNNAEADAEVNKTLDRQALQAKDNQKPPSEQEGIASSA